MRVGVYVDGFNLYYGGKAHFGRGVAGWRWIDVRGLAQGLLQRRQAWTASGARLERIVYCTARIDSKTNPTGFAKQDIYLKALLTSRSVDHIEYGHYVDRVKNGPLATRDPSDGRAVLVRPGWPLMIQDSVGAHIDATFIVSYAHREEKGSDVNVGAHLLLDILEDRVDAAIVISNDSDLKFPVREARKRVPVGTVNPHKRLIAGTLRGQQSDGVGGHWWIQLRPEDYTSNQLPDPCGKYSKPADW